MPTNQLFGWIPYTDRTKPQQKKHDEIIEALPPFNLIGDEPKVVHGDRFALWEANLKLLNRHATYVWQSSGSCVGAAGSNMLRTMQAIEIAMKGDFEEYKETWWLYTYGRSRYHSGMGGKGEGSTGSGWAKAITDDGVFAYEGLDLPKYEDKNGWIKLSSRIEVDWSDGRFDKKYIELGREHLVKTASRMKNADDCKKAVSSGYALTIACNFGTNTIRPRGNPKVNLAEWDSSWAHQQYSDEYWEHPDLGAIFRIGNNWGPNAHPAPLDREPPGGYYVTEKVMDRMCQDEVFSYSVFNGFPARDISGLFDLI